MINAADSLIIKQTKLKDPMLKKTIELRNSKIKNKAKYEKKIESMLSEITPQTKTPTPSTTTDMAKAKAEGKSFDEFVNSKY
jgi:hypothetical protein